MVVIGNGLVEGIVLRVWTFFRVKTRSLIGRRRRLCTVPFLEAPLLKKLDFWCCLGDVSADVSRSKLP
jgi:hypothetical protein